MIGEIGMVAGIGLLIYGALRLENSDQKLRKSDHDLRLAIDAALRGGSCKCPRCGGTGWKKSFYPPHYYYAIDCASCGHNGGDSYTFATNNGIAS